MSFSQLLDSGLYFFFRICQERFRIFFFLRLSGFGLSFFRIEVRLQNDLRGHRVDDGAPPARESDSLTIAMCSKPYEIEYFFIFFAKKVLRNVW